MISNETAIELHTPFENLMVIFFGLNCHHTYSTCSSAEQRSSVGHNCQKEELIDWFVVVLVFAMSSLRRPRALTSGCRGERARRRDRNQKARVRIRSGPSTDHLLPSEEIGLLIGPNSLREQLLGPVISPSDTISSMYPSQGQRIWPHLGLALQIKALEVTAHAELAHVRPL